MFLVAVLPVVAGIVSGQESLAPAQEERAAHLARMKAVASTIHVFAEPGKPDSQAELVSEPVLRYADNTR